MLLARFTSPAVNRTNDYQPGMLGNLATFFVVGAFLAGVYLSGGVPLYQVLRGSQFYVQEGSAFHLHTFTFWTVFSTIRFADFTYSRRWRYLFEAALPVIFFALMVYRGPALMCVLTWLFVYVLHRGSLTFRQCAIANNSGTRRHVRERCDR